MSHEDQKFKEFILNKIVELKRMCSNRSYNSSELISSQFWLLLDDSQKRIEEISDDK